MGEDQRRDLVMELYNFIKDGNLETDLLMRDKKLAILSSHLFSLNKLFATYNSSEILDTTRREAVEFLRDFCFRIPTLKLVHTPESAPGAIDVSRLHSLRHLEIGKAPVHLLTGLRSLRQQLEVLICTRCLHSVEILVGKCGGDKAEEQNWPRLHTLNLSFNYLTNIDESLQFLPSLRALDLSHNQIKSTGDFLECLSELQHLNISYNCLSRAPSLAQGSQRKLKSLNLRNNDIQYLEGVHLLENLAFLDLSRNCIYSEQTLGSLNYVWQISGMYLHGNPISLEPQYRQMVTRNLPPAAAFRNVYLDGRLLTEAEIKMIPTQRKAAFYSFPPGGNQPASILNKAAQFSELSVDSFEESGDYSSSGTPKPLKPRERRKKKKIRIRPVRISEQAQREELPTVTPKSVEDSHLEEAKREFERKREEHGSDWLLALQDPYRRPVEPINGKSPFVEAEWEGGTCETSDRRSQTPDAIMESNDRLTDRGSDNDLIVTAKVEITNGQHTGSDFTEIEEFPENGHRETGSEAGCEARDIGREGMDREEEHAVNGRIPIVVVENGTEEAALGGDKRSKEADGSMTGYELRAEYEGHSEQSAATADKMGGGVEEGYRLERCSSEEDLCGPLLVRASSNGGFTEILLTVKQTHLEESDLNGEVQERLELKSLLSVDVSEKQVPEEGLVPVVSLNFEYVRKDRRARNYYMEDQSSAENLSGVLEAFWQENQQKTVAQYMSCLKCAGEFLLSEAVMVVDRPKGRKSSDQQDNALNEVPTCPYCGNRYLVEGEQSSATRNGNPIPVIGSLTSSTKPLATSSPWKEKENGTASTSLGLSSRFLSSSPPSLGPDVPSVMTTGQDETPNDSMSSVDLDVSLKLPESTIPSNSLEAKTPIEEVAAYPRDQLNNLLKTDKSNFKDRYSLVQQLSVDGSTNRTAGAASQQEDVILPSKGQALSTVPTAATDEDIYGGKSELSDEDDFDILEDPQEGRKTSEDDSEAIILPTQVPHKGKGMLLAKSKAGEGRHGSNESDIAVLSDRERHDSDPKAWMEGSTTSADNVFGSTEVDSSAYQSNKGGGYGSSSKASGSEREETGETGYQSSGDGWKAADSGIEGSASSSKPGEDRRQRKISMLTSIQDNYRAADHRLKLFYSMSLFSSDEEEFRCHITGSICTTSMLGYVSYEGLVVVSTSHVYVMKIVKEESDRASDFLNKKIQASLQELLYIHVGLGSQLLQFEFTSDGGGRFTLLVGDRFNVESFSKLLQESIVSRGNLPKFEGIKEHQLSLNTLLADLLDEDDDLQDWSQTFYVHGLDPKPKDSSYMRPGILLTEEFIYLVEENCSWPLMGDKSQGKVPTRGQHYTLKEHFSITDITDVDCNLQELKVFINFSDEDEEREGQWELRMSTASSMRQMLNAINRPWSEQFGVDLTVSYVGIDSNLRLASTASYKDI